MNSATFAGRLGRDPELRATASGQSVCSFSLAVNRFKKEDGALWIDVSVWGKQGENVARYLRKGSEAVVSGRVDLQEFTKRDGTYGAKMSLDAKDVTFVGARNDSPEPVGVGAVDDDIAF